MDRISDSGSDGCGSIPHGATDLTPSRIRDSPCGACCDCFSNPRQPFRLSVFCGRQNTRPGCASSDALRDPLTPSRIRDNPCGACCDCFSNPRQPFRLSVFCARQNTRPGCASYACFEPSCLWKSSIWWPDGTICGFMDFCR